MDRTTTDAEALIHLLVYGEFAPAAGREVVEEIRRRGPEALGQLARALEDPDLSPTTRKAIATLLVEQCATPAGKQAGECPPSEDAVETAREARKEMEESSRSAPPRARSAAAGPVPPEPAPTSSRTGRSVT